MRSRLAAGLLALCLGATACSGGDGEASPTLPPVTESPSATPEAEAVPSEATEATPEGAAEFAKYFANEVHQAYITQDAERVARLSAPDCEACQAYISSIEEMRSVDATIADNYTVEVLDAQAAGLPPEANTARVTVLLRIGEFLLTAPDGSELLREPANDRAVQELSLMRVEGGWLTTGVTTS
jgi:hypothetical protein